jgi:NAD(P)-dependent dehydrogenase (short-subunit alcohol dehydrogenase family)
MTDSLKLNSFGRDLNVAVIGASGGIGGAIANQLDECQTVSRVVRLSRTVAAPSADGRFQFHLDLQNERSIGDAADTIAKSLGVIHIVFVATGLLHQRYSLMQPEKTWRSLSSSALETAFHINTIGPALIAKHFLPLHAKDRKSVFAALSARVGSIQDNHLGGWYAYRASKAGLNMMIKTLSIELARRNPGALFVGLHPGTVDTALSKPFQGGVREGKLFSPDHSARYLLRVLDGLTPAESGGIFAWDGSVIPA